MLNYPLCCPNSVFMVKLLLNIQYSYTNIYYFLISILTNFVINLYYIKKSLRTGWLDTFLLDGFDWRHLLSTHFAPCLFTFEFPPSFSSLHHNPSSLIPYSSPIPYLSSPTSPPPPHTPLTPVNPVSFTDRRLVFQYT